MSRRSLNWIRLRPWIVHRLGPRLAVEGSGQRIRLSYILVRNGVDVLDIERNDLLWLVVFQNREVFRLESLDEISVLVPDSDIHQNQFALHAKRVVVPAAVPAA